MITPTLKRGTYPSGTPFWLVSCSLDSGRYKKKWDNELEARQDMGRLVRQFNGGIDEDGFNQARLAIQYLKSHRIEAVQVVDIFELTKWAAERYVLANQSKPLKAHYDNFIRLKEKQGKREDTLAELKRLVGRFAYTYRDENPANFDEKRIADYCDSKRMNPKHRLAIKHFFGYLSGTSKLSPNSNPVLLKNPIGHWAKPHDLKEGTEHIAILTQPEAFALIKKAADFSAQRMFVWMLFTGMRPTETYRFWTDQRFGWNRIHLEEGVIDVSGLMSKVRGRHREIKIRPVLKAWLDKYPESEYESWLPMNHRGRYSATRKAVLPKEKIVDDICRHTWHSFLLADGEAQGDLILQAGNSMQIQLKHYLRLIRDKDKHTVSLYWSMTPDKFSKFDRTGDQLKTLARENRTRAILENRQKG